MFGIVNRRQTRNAAALAASVILSSCLHTSALAGMVKVPFSDVPGAATEIDHGNSTAAAPFIRKMIQAAAAQNSYSFHFEIVSTEKRNSEEEGTLYYKKGSMRVEETGDIKRGAVAVVTPEGKIRGHLGGMLGSVTMNLKPDSQILRSVNNWPVVRSDFLSIAKAIQEFDNSGCDVNVSETPESVKGRSEKVYIVEISEPNKSSELYKRVYVDPETMLPVELLDYKNGQVWAKSEWKGFTTVVSEAPKLFEL